MNIGAVMFFSFALAILNYAFIVNDIVNDESWNIQIVAKCGKDALVGAF